MNPKMTERFLSEATRPQTMTTAELMDAISSAKEVRVYVPASECWLEVRVAKTKILAALETRIEEFPFSDEPNWTAEWVEEGVLLVGGE